MTRPALPPEARRLILMRHAKSAWPTEVSDDRSRPLNERGRRDASRMAVSLAERGWVPERVMSSDATRTRETWALMQDAFVPPAEVEFLTQLYDAGLAEIRAIASAVPPSVQTIMILGHNPGWEEAVTELAGQEVTLTTANAALLEGTGDSWATALGPHVRWRLVAVLRPKETPG